MLIVVAELPYSVPPLIENPPLKFNVPPLATKLPPLIVVVPVTTSVSVVPNWKVPVPVDWIVKLPPIDVSTLKKVSGAVGVPPVCPVQL